MASSTIYSQKDNSMKRNTLIPEEKRVIIDKGTERPFTGKYENHSEKGYYTCKQCDRALYKSESKFHSGCGWPSFDDEIPGAVARYTDADGRRTEIVCSNCDGHLGHVFIGEGFTSKNTRHCVNSISMNFIAESDIDTAIFASGCFWGTEYFLQKAKGVISTEVGYIGGKKDKPTYKEVCTGRTGHAEAVRVIFKKSETDFETLAKLFFETHDFTQVGGQGPDIGDQYRSEIFFLNEEQKEVSQKLINILSEKGYLVATGLSTASKFWVAENYHQSYYENNGKTPYCHRYRSIFK